MPNSSDHPKTPRPKAKAAPPIKTQMPEWYEDWLKLDQEVQSSKRDADETDRNKKKQQLYQKFPNKSPKAT